MLEKHIPLEGCLGTGGGGVAVSGGVQEVGMCGVVWGGHGGAAWHLDWMNLRVSSNLDDSVTCFKIKLYLGLLNASRVFKVFSPSVANKIGGFYGNGS